MKKILSFLLCLLMVLGSFSGAITVSAEATNLLSGISVADFGTNDKSLNGGFGFEQYTDGIYGAAFNVKCAWYTSFYIKLPALSPNTDYNFSFKYDNVKTEKVGEILKIDLINADEIATANENGYVNQGVGTRLGTRIALDKGEWSDFEASFTTAAETTDYYINIQTDYAYWLHLCDFKLLNGDVYSVSVTGDTTDKSMAQTGETVTVTAAPAENQTFLGWIATSGNVTFADPYALTATFTMPKGNVSVLANYKSEGSEEITPNLLANISLDNFASKDQTPTTKDFGFTAQTDGAYGTKYKVTDAYYTTFYVKLPQLEKNTEYFISFSYDNSINEKNPGEIEQIHILNDSQLASVDSNGKVTDSGATLIGKNIPLDNGEWRLFSGYFTTSSEDTNYYLNFKTGYAYWFYLSNFTLKKTVPRAVEITNGTADKGTAKVGETVTVTTTTAANQRFMGWNVIKGETTLENPLSTETTFVMPDSSVEIKAEYYENLWANIDTSYFGTNDKTTPSGFGFEAYKDGNYGTAFNIKNSYYTSFYVKLPALDVNEEYNISFKYDNVLGGNKGEILKIDLLTEDEIATADDNGNVKSSVGKRLGTNLALDKGKWSTLGYTFTTDEAATNYYLNVQTNYAFWLRLCDFKITKNYSKGITINGGSSDNPFALDGELVRIYADETENFSHWQVLSGGITVENPYSETASFTMGTMAADIKAVYLNDGEIKTIYTDLDGAEIVGSISSLHKTTLTDNGDGTKTAKIDLYSFDGAYVFGGFYNGDTMLSVKESYTFNTAEVDETTLTAKVIALNVIDGDPGFESYANNSTARVEPANKNVLPYNERWGIWNRYNSASNGIVKGYENHDWGYTIKNYSGTVTDYYKDYTYSPETAVYSLDAVKTPYTVTPYHGNSMIGASLKSRSMVRKLQNLKPNTEYRISFYVNNPSKTDFLNRIIVSNTYDMDAGNVELATDGVYALYQDYDNFADINTIRNWGKMSITFKTPADADSVYLHFAFLTQNPHSAESKIYIDNLTCVPAVVSYSGNAIRKNTSDLPQALRYKFFIENEKLENIGGMEVTQIGILAMDNSVLNGKELVLDGKYGKDGLAPRVGIVQPENIQAVEGDSTHSYFTAALYNIGKSGNKIDYNKYSTDFTVRPFVKLKTASGEEIVMYSAHYDASVFSVVKAIYTSKNNASDRAAADEIMQSITAKNLYSEWETKEFFFISKDEVTDYAFSMAIVGDPQKTVYYYPDELHYTYDWIVNNKDAKNIQHVITLGDITEFHGDEEYALIENELKKLENAGIKQSIVRGNHDTPDSFDKHITKEEYGSYLSGSFDNTMKNVYQIVNLGNKKYLILTIDYYPEADVVDWAAGIVAANPDCSVIINTHGFLEPSMQSINNTQINYLNKNLIEKYENIDLVLCGHSTCTGDNGPVYKTVTGENGNKIVEMMINPQELERAKLEAFGLVSMFYFGNDGKTITVEWYSTIRQAFYMEKYQFTFTIE